MVAPHDFVALIVWIGFLLAFRRAASEDYVDLNRPDMVFVSVVVLVALELVWLRVGYPAP